MQFTVMPFAYSNMNALLEKIEENLLRSIDSNEENKRKQVSLDIDSYSLHKAECDKIDSALRIKVGDLLTKLSQRSWISGDWASERNIRSFLDQKVNRLLGGSRELDQKAQTIVSLINNPSKLPTPPIPSEQNNERKE
jgi:hypothetical protein